MFAGKSYLAPMLDVTDNPGFLYLCKKYGCDVLVLPMAFLEGISANPAYIDGMLDMLFNNVQGFDFRPIVVQLIGQTVDLVKQVFDILSSYDIQGLNLNMGCPSTRVNMQGLGSRMLERPQERDAIIDEMLKHSPFPFSIKMRLFSDSVAGRTVPNIDRTIAFCKSLEGKAISEVILHGRTACLGYRGKANWDAIRAVHEATSLPLVGNGDITCWQDGMERVHAGDCDAFMIGRAAIKDPRVFSPGQDPKSRKIIDDAYALFKDLVDFLAPNERETARKYYESHQFRKIVLQFSRDTRGGRDLRLNVMKTKNLQDILDLFTNLGATGGTSRPEFFFHA